MAWQKPDRASLPVPRAIRTFLRAMYAPSIVPETPRPSTCRRPQPIEVARDSIHAPPSAADRDQLHRAETPSTRRRPLPNSQETQSRQKTATSRHEFKDTLLPSHDNLLALVALCLARESIY